MNGLLVSAAPPAQTEATRALEALRAWVEERARELARTERRRAYLDRRLDEVPRDHPRWEDARNECIELGFRRRRLTDELEAQADRYRRLAQRAGLPIDGQLLWSVVRAVAQEVKG